MLGHKALILPIGILAGTLAGCTQDTNGGAGSVPDSGLSGPGDRVDAGGDPGPDAGNGAGADGGGAGAADGGGSDTGPDLPAMTVLLFGGDDGTELSDETWRWDGEGWAGVFTADEPDARRDHALAYDFDRERVVLFGGYDDSSYRQDTWEWNGDGWQAHFGAPSGLQGRSGHDMVYDAARERVVLFGGSYFVSGPGFIRLDDTWFWDGHNWQESPSSSDLSARDGHAMAYDAAREQVVLFGGNDGGDFGVTAETWVYDDAGWRDVSPSPSQSPPARREHAMAYDPIRERIVLFGGTTVGSSAADDTWDWDGKQGVWTEMDGTARPIARSGHQLVFDPDRETILLVGGEAGGDPIDETMEWDGSQWQLIPDASGPPRAGHALAHAPEP